MIDYISVLFNFKHPRIPAGHLISVAPDGQVDWDTAKAMNISGSHESSIRIRSMGELDQDGDATQLFVTGNPAKFLQGHNIFGSDELIPMLTEVMRRICFSLDMPQMTNAAIESGTVSRIDFTKSIQFENKLEVQAYIGQIALQAKSRSGRPIAQGWTVAFQARSRRWSLVVYSKGDELNAHKIPESLPVELLQNEADRLARVELRLKTLELKKLEKRVVSDFSQEILHSLYEDYIERIEMSTEISIPSEELMSLPRAIRDTYLMWRENADVRVHMSKATYYRHRAALSRMGIDITIPFVKEATATVIPIKKVLTGRPYTTPEWAEKEGLIFKPKAKRILQLCT